MNGYVKDVAKLAIEGLISLLTAPYLLRKRMPLLDQRHEELVNVVKCVQRDASEVKEDVAYIKGRVDVLVQQSRIHDSR